MLAALAINDVEPVSDINRKPVLGSIVVEEADLVDGLQTYSSFKGGRGAAAVKIVEFVEVKLGRQTGILKLAV